MGVQRDDQCINALVFDVIPKSPVQHQPATKRSPMAPVETTSPATAQQQSSAGAHASDNRPRIAIRAFQAADHAQVVALFREGMLFYTPEASHPQHSVWVDYVAHSVTADLADIPSHYQHGGDGSNFFVAMATTDDGQEEIVGCLGLEHKPDQEGVAELRRVSVKAAYRRFGIGRLLMAHVTQWAQERQYTKLILSNAATQLLAHKFYDSLGYTLTKTSVFCHEPYFELTHFEKEV